MTGARRTRTFLAAVALSLAAIGVSPALAGDASTYVGEAEKDPETYIEFKLSTSKPKQVSDFIASLRFACDDGNFYSLLFGGEGSMNLNKKKRFKGMLPAALLGTPRGAVTDATLKVGGKLLKKGKAKGTVDAEFTVPTSDPADPRCYSGKLDWKALRGTPPE